MRTSWLLVSTILGSTSLTAQSISTNTTCDLTKEFDCGTGILGCLPKAWQCDNVKDCHNGADETNCEPNKCKEGELLCQSGRCVEDRFKCDRYTDCFFDDTDEKFCEYNSRRLNVLAPFNFGDSSLYTKNGGYDSNGCRPGFGYCAKQKLCIPNLLFCDGHRDCNTGYEDERNCTQSFYMRIRSSPCENKFMCSKNSTWDDQVCIQMEELCNGKKDCPLGDDESEKCSECSTKHCEHDCKNIPTGAKCECNEGYRLDSDGFSCVDIDECTLPERACDHFCENQMGSFLCSCAKGYQLKADGKTCEPTIKTEGTLLIGHKDEIRQIPLEDFTVMDSTSTHKTEEYLEAFAYSRRHNTFFLSRCDNFIAEQCHLVVGENGKSRILRGNASELNHLAVDWIGGNIFFTERVEVLFEDSRSMTRISACTMDGKFCRGIIDGNLQDLRHGFVIHPMRGLLFFSDQQNRTHRLMMANMDGSQMQPLFESDSTWIAMLTIDYVNNDIYFRDFYTENLHRFNIDTRENEVIASKLRIAVLTESMVYHNGFLYWPEVLGEVRVLDVRRRGVGVHQILHHHFRLKDYRESLTHLVVNATSQQLEPSHNPCKELDCPWICVIVPGFTAKCLCPDGYISSILGTTCIPSTTKDEEQDNLTHIGLELMSEYCKTGVGCLNGGSCREVLNKTRIVCDCVGPYDGLYCERRKPMVSDEAILIVILVIVLILLLIAIGYVVYWFFFVHRKNKKDEVLDTVSIVSKSTIGTVVYYENDAVSLG